MAHFGGSHILVVHPKRKVLMSDLAELLERFRRAPEVIAMMLTGVKPEEEDFAPAEGKWTIRQITRHLADSEMVGAYRFRSVIAEDNPTLQNYAEGAWASKTDYQRRKFTQSLELFRRVRADNYELLNGLPAETFDRKGTHSVRGELTLKDLLTIYAQHAESHADQLRAARDIYKESKAKK